jgi:hypothetical protein
LFEIFTISAFSSLKRKSTTGDDYYYDDIVAAPGRYDAHQQSPSSHHNRIVEELDGDEPDCGKSPTK